MSVRIDPRQGAGGPLLAPAAAAPAASPGAGTLVTRGNGRPGSTAVATDPSGTGGPAADRPGSFAAAMSQATSQAGPAAAPAPLPAAPVRPAIVARSPSGPANVPAADTPIPAATPMATRPPQATTQAAKTQAGPADTSKAPTAANAQAPAAARDTTSNTGPKAPAPAPAKPAAASGKSAPATPGSAANDPSANLAAASVAGIAGVAAMSNPTTPSNATGVDRDSATTAVGDKSGSADGYGRAAPMDAASSARAAQAGGAATADETAQASANTAAAGKRSADAGDGRDAGPPEQSPANTPTSPFAALLAPPGTAAAGSTPQDLATASAVGTPVQRSTDANGGRLGAGTVLAGKALATAGTGANAGDTASANAPADTTAAGFAAVAAAALKAAGPAAAGLPASGTDPAGGSSIDSAVATALSQFGATGSAPQNTTAASVQVPVASRVGDADFGAAVSHQLVSLARTGVQSAELVLNPAHLGPVSVSIQMSGQQASLSMTAEHEATRTALREALPHLDALFSQSGLQLGSAHVGDGSERNSGRQGSPADRSPLPFTLTGTPAPAAIGTPAAARATGVTRLVDTFA